MEDIKYIRRNGRRNYFVKRAEDLPKDPVPIMDGTDLYVIERRYFEEHPDEFLLRDDGTYQFNREVTPEEE